MIIEDLRRAMWHEPHDFSKDYFTTTAISTCVFTFNMHSGLSATDYQDIAYSVDNGFTWTSPISNVTDSDVTVTTPSISPGKKVIWRGHGYTLCTSSSATAALTAADLTPIISSTGDYSVSGNIASLLWGDDYFGPKTISTTGYGHVFAGLFINSTNLIYANDLVLLNVTTYGSSYQTYAFMFYGCTGLIASPKIPHIENATGTISYARTYDHMFMGCSSLLYVNDITQPRLDARACQYMFSDCSSLVRAPQILATAGTTNSCYYMFNYCTNLVYGPEIYIETITGNYVCYHMFEHCTNLQHVSSILPAMSLRAGSYQGMFIHCKSITHAPILPALKVASNAYNNMFTECSNLNWVKAMFTSPTPSSSITASWLSGVASTGTFVKNVDATWNVTGPNGIPSGWTVETASS